jgi:phage-related protein
MATFPTSPAVSYGVSKTSKPKIRRVQFGDGYSKQISWSMNQNPKIWNLSFENITETESDTIETFLDARADDADSFTWTPPNEASSGKYLCLDWSKQINFAGYATINATFEEVFEP